MLIGEQLEFPEGYRSFEKGKVYSYAGGSTVTGLKTLVEFTTQKSGRRVHLHRIDQDAFQLAVRERFLQVCETQATVPPWLAGIAGMDIDAMDLKRQSAMLTNRSRAEQRYTYIEPLLVRLPEILAANRPFSIINEVAAQGPKKQNRTRLAEWFFAYICFGRNLLALYPEFHNTGRYDRGGDESSRAHVGRPSLSKGRLHGFASLPMAEAICESYRRHMRPGKPMTEIYRDAIVQDWGVRGRVNSKGLWEFYHPEGRPFPDSYGKFRYRVIVSFGIEWVQRNLYGPERIRNKQSLSKGSFSEEVSNLLERTEVDAYYVEEHPVSPITGKDMPRLVVVRAKCLRSKCIVGIGFSVENEEAEGYRSMLFSMSLDKHEFAAMLGIGNGILPWPCRGLPAHLIPDRGSAPAAAIVNDLQSLFPVRELPRPYSGQGKASVESSHPRTVTQEGRPSERISKLNMIQLVQREFALAALHNHTSDASTYIAGDRLRDMEAPTPYAIWNDLDSLGQNDGISISEEAAVRAFLVPLIVELREGGIWVEDRNFYSDEFEASGIMDMVMPGQTVELKGFCMQLCLLYLWVEVKGRLMKLEQRLPFRDKFGLRLLSRNDLIAEAKLRRELESSQRSGSAAAAVSARHLFQQATGKEWGDYSVRNYRPKKRDAFDSIEIRALKSKRRKSA